jgi:hypothetical protein
MRRNILADFYLSVHQNMLDSVS